MTNNPFAETMALKNAFDSAVAIFDRIVAGDTIDLDVIAKASGQLNTCNANFSRALYVVLEPVTDWNKQNEIYELIKRLIDNDRMFNQEFTGDAYDEAVRNAPNGIAGFQLIQFLPALREACSWFSDGRYKLSGFRRYYERDCLGVRAPTIKPVPVVAPLTHDKHQGRISNEKPLSAFFIHNADVHIEKIGQLLQGAKGKRVATIIRVLQELGYITLASGEYKQLYRAIRAHYNADIGVDSGITKYLSGTSQIPERELVDMKKQLQ